MSQGSNSSLCSENTPMATAPRSNTFVFTVFLRKTKFPPRMPVVSWPRILRGGLGFVNSCLPNESGRAEWHPESCSDDQFWGEVYSKQLDDLSPASFFCIGRPDAHAAGSLEFHPQKCEFRFAPGASSHRCLRRTVVPMYRIWSVGLQSRFQQLPCGSIP